MHVTKHLHPPTTTKEEEEEEEKTQYGRGLAPLSRSMLPSQPLHLSHGRQRAFWLANSKKVGGPGSTNKKKQISGSSRVRTPPASLCSV